jgi:hypothetical protein
MDYYKRKWGDLLFFVIDNNTLIYLEGKFLMWRLTIALEVSYLFERVRNKECELFVAPTSLLHPLMSRQPHFFASLFWNGR